MAILTVLMSVDKICRCEAEVEVQLILQGGLAVWAWPFHTAMSSWIDGDEILFNFDEEIVYVSIGCSVDSLDSLDQLLPWGLRKFFNVRPQRNIWTPFQH